MNEERVLLDYANDDQALLCLLYDLDLMPEQTIGGDKYDDTLAIIDHWRAYRLQTDQEREADRAAIRALHAVVETIRMQVSAEYLAPLACFDDVKTHAPAIQRATQAPDVSVRAPMKGQK